MRILHPKIVFFVLLLCICWWDRGLCAESIYIWTHEDSEIRITDRPPPKDAKILDIFRYHPRSQRSLEDLEKQEQQGRLDLEKKAAIERAQKARERAGEARQRAEEAKSTVNHAQGQADVLIDEVGHIRTKRKKYGLEIDRAEALAQKTKELAIEAERRALEAEELARQAEIEALGYTEEPPSENVGEPTH